jgi:hypothetical protein
MMFDGLSKILSFKYSFHNYPRIDPTKNSIIDADSIWQIVNIYKTCEIRTESLQFTMGQNIIIMVTKSYIEYHNNNTGIKYLYNVRNELNLNNFQSIKQYLNKTYDVSYLFNDFMENSIIITYLVYYM